MMENISKILDAISQEAGVEADRIIENGEKNCREIRRACEEEAAAKCESIIARAEKRVREIERRSISQAGMEIRNIRLAARREMLDKAFSAAAGKLAALDKEARKTLYERCIEKYSCGSDITVQMNMRDSAELGSKLKVKGKNIGIDKNCGSFIGGLIIKESRTETNCTFEALVENAKKDMEPEIASVLFSQS